MSLWAVRIRGFLIGGLVAASAVAVVSSSLEAGQADTSPLVSQLTLVGPPGSATFGRVVVVLANGNYVVTDPSWDDGGTANVGAVYLYDGDTNTVISTLTGTTAGEGVGFGGVTALTNGNYVVASPDWSGVAPSGGAVTWVNGTTGIDGPVTTTNSLYGESAGDKVGLVSPTVLTNGNYVVRSPLWSGVASGAGAVTFGIGTTGITGPVAITNSLYGTSVGDRVGSSGVTALTNGNYVVASPNWDTDITANVGAATWGNGTTGITGPVTTDNSLHGTDLNDNVGNEGATPLTNGNYVVRSTAWNNGASDVGAVTWGNGITGITGAVTTSNSLYGTTIDDNIGLGEVAALSNGNYVVASKNWNNGGADEVGAATWGDGTTGTTGPVTTDNSLRGTANFDRVGSRVTALSNGNYVVSSGSWDNGGVANAGAATWLDGTTGASGAVTTANSLYGTASFDGVGGRVTALSNGNYVVASPEWDNGAVTGAGAATWGNGTTGITGAVSTSNSLYGTTAGDRVSFGGVTALTNGNYVVISREWNSGAVPRTGAATWADGTTGTSGVVSTTNSLYGTTNSDIVGNGGVTALTNGDYVVRSVSWDSGGVVNAGAVTFGLGDVATGGVVSSANSVIGTPPGQVMSPSGLLTSGDAVAVPTSQNRVLLMLLDRAPFFTATPSDVNAQTVAGASTVKVDYPLPVAKDLRSTPTVACAPASGSLFPVGTTAVLCTATDSTGLTATTGFDVTVTAPDFVSVTPARLLDTRPGQSTTDGLFNGDGQRQGGTTLTLKIAGRAGVPADSVAAAINVTAANTAARGFITVFPCDQTRPNASNLNLNPGVVVPNLVITALDSNGEVCIYTHTATDVIVDVAGYFPDTTTFETINPARLLDTRPGGVTIDGQSARTGIAQAGETTVVQITGRAGIPADATAAALNLTLTGTTGQMFATIWPCDTARPEASNINATGGATIANSAIAKLAANGTICIYTLKASEVILDAAGWFTNISDYNPLTPARLLDTRPGATTIDGQSAGVGLRPAGTTTTLQITDRGGAPSRVATVVVNVTATQTVTRGFITVYPCNETRPNASNLNYRVGTTVANNVIVKVSPTGTICLYNHTPTQLIADINGYLPN